MTTLPTFITHNEATSDFTVAKTDDLSLIGGYAVTIRSQIQVPTDHTKTDFKIMESEIDLLIRVEACLVDLYDAG